MRYPGIPIHGYTKTSAQWYTGTQMQKYTTALLHQYAISQPWHLVLALETKWNPNCEYCWGYCTLFRHLRGGGAHVLREGHMGNAPSPVFFTLPIQRPRYKLCHADLTFAFSLHRSPCSLFGSSWSSLRRSTDSSVDAGPIEAVHICYDLWYGEQTCA